MADRPLEPAEVFPARRWHLLSSTQGSGGSWKSGEETMSQHDSTLLWLRDTLSHLSACQKQLEWTDDPDALELLTSSMQRDLERCQDLLQTVRRRVRSG